MLFRWRNKEETKMRIFALCFLISSIAWGAEWKNKFDLKKLPSEGKVEIIREKKVIKFNNLAAAAKDLKSGDTLKLLKGTHKPPVAPGSYGHEEIPYWYNTSFKGDRIPQWWAPLARKIDPTPMWSVPGDIKIVGEGIGTFLVLSEYEGAPDKPAQWILRARDKDIKIENLRLVNVRLSRLDRAGDVLMQDVIFDYKLHIPEISAIGASFRSGTPVAVCLFCVNWTTSEYRKEHSRVVWIGSLQFDEKLQYFEGTSKYDDAFKALDEFSMSLEKAREKGTLDKGDKAKAKLALTEVKLAKPSAWKASTASVEYVANEFDGTRSTEFDFSSETGNWLKAISTYLEEKY